MATCVEYFVAVSALAVRFRQVIIHRNRARAAPLQTSRTSDKAYRIGVGGSLAQLLEWEQLAIVE